eukprot:CAMPEP_0194689058 /NCGR_PEP_ID=MMETSP0295-20121207/17347_1 /TAXON_ID=39354 /ORGANISM="Heterosigma akashiwo, Strain CCMP2393" /LENGTH=74 /DNA_ID=CAMNT_0039577951 /DNA_START=453 /DNA_END=677 /DNA_ORIENTATION=+
MKYLEGSAYLEAGGWAAIVSAGVARRRYKRQDCILKVGIIITTITITMWELEVGGSLLVEAGASVLVVIRPAGP